MDVISHFSTYKDNNFINHKEYEDKLKIAYGWDADLLDCVLNGKLGHNLPNLAFYKFNRDKHCTEDVKFNPAYPLWVSTDFNVNPQCAVVCQFDPFLNWCYFIKEYRMPNSGVVEMCQQIKLDYPTALVMIEGDRTGWNRKQDGTYGLTNNYQILRDHLHLNWSQIKVPKTSNPPHSDTLNIVNMCLSTIDIKFHTSMVYTILDMETVQINSNKEIQTPKDSNMGHLLDCVRYLFFGQFINFHKLNALKKQ
jgi:phage terminase large subunit